MTFGRFVTKWMFTIAGIALIVLFLPMHTHGSYELWAITRMAWWIVFLVYVNELYREWKNKKPSVHRISTVWHPTAAKWVNRWGMSWSALVIIIPTMLITFFFVMLVVFA